MECHYEIFVTINADLIKKYENCKRNVSQQYVLVKEIEVLQQLRVVQEVR